MREGDGTRYFKGNATGKSLKLNYLVVVMLMNFTSIEALVVHQCFWVHLLTLRTK